MITQERLIWMIENQESFGILFVMFPIDGEDYEDVCDRCNQAIKNIQGIDNVFIMETEIDMYPYNNLEENTVPIFVRYINGQIKEVVKSVQTFKTYKSIMK